MAKLLPEGANILRFQSAFEITEIDPAPMDVLEWVYCLTEAQQKQTPLEKLPEDTTLRRNMKAYLLSGGKVGTARGRLKRSFHQ